MVTGVSCTMRQPSAASCGRVLLPACGQLNTVLLLGGEFAPSAWFGP
jgi:hypothetical protein